MNRSPEPRDHLVYTLTDLFPLPPDDSPGAARARNRAAIAKVTALRLVNPNKADLGGPRERWGYRTDDRRAARDRTGARKHETMAKNVSQDDMNSHEVAFETEMSAPVWNRSAGGIGPFVSVFAQLSPYRIWRGGHYPWSVDAEGGYQDLERMTAARPEAAPTPRMKPMMAETISKNDTNSHDVAFETGMSENPRNQGGIAGNDNPPPDRDFVPAGCRSNGLNKASLNQRMPKVCVLSRPGECRPGAVTEPSLPRPPGW